MYYYNLLNKTQKLLYNDLLERMKNAPGPYIFEEIKLTLQEVSHVYQAITMDHPSLVLPISLNDTTFEKRGNTICIVNRDSRYESMESLQKKQEQANDYIQKLAASVSHLKDTSDLEHRALIRGICKQFYETTIYRYKNALYNDCAYGLSLGYGMCQGFARTTKAVLDLLDIDSICIRCEIPGEKSIFAGRDPVPHLMNALLLEDGSRLYFDPTRAVTHSKVYLNEQLRGRVRDVYATGDYNLHMPLFYNENTMRKEYIYDGKYFS